MTKAILVGGYSRAVRALVAALVERGEPVIWLGGRGQKVGHVISLGAPEDESAWRRAVTKANTEHGGIARVLNLLTNPAPRGVLGTISYEQFDVAVVATMARTIGAMRATIPVMRDGGGGAFLTLWEQESATERDSLMEPVLLAGLEMSSRVIAKEYASLPTVRVNLVKCRSVEVSLDVLLFWSNYLGGDAGCYVTGANIGSAAH